MKQLSISFAIAILLLLFGGCSTSQESTKPNPYERKPITEVTQQQLEQDNLLIAAKTQQLVGNHENAMTQYSKLLAQQPKNAVLWYEVGRMMMQQGEQDSALHYLSRAVALDNNNVWYKLALANVYEFRHDGKNLIALWEGIVKQHPETLEYYYELSNAHLKNNDVEGAIAVLNRVEKRVGVTEPISLQKQRLWDAIGKGENARREIEALADAMPQEKKYNAMLAELCMQQKNYAKAKQYYDRIAAADSADEFVHISLANYYKLTGQPEKAYQELRQGFLNPRLDGGSKLQVLGSFYTDEEFYGTYSQQAFELLDIAMQQCPDSTAYALFYGDVLMRQQKYAEAAHQFKIHLASDSSLYEAWEALLICETEMQHNEAELLNFAKRAAALFPLHTLPYYIQAFVAIQHSDYEETLRQLKQCEMLCFNKGYLEEQTYSMMAEAYHALHQYKEAIRYYDLCLKLSPNDIGLLNNFAYCLAEAGERLEEALKMSARTVDQEPQNSTFLDTYAWLLHKLGKHQEALQQINKALAHDTKTSDTLLQHKAAIEAALKGSSINSTFNSK